ncbi:MAG: GNAT family N-acetyltransferase [Hyphomicrobiaceae bacterium]
MHPVLETERLRMRPWCDQDLDAFADFCADEESTRYLGGVCDRADAWRRMAVIAGHWALRGYGIWVIEDKATGAFAGYSGLWNPEGWPGPEVTWSVCTPFRRRGYAVEAAQRAREFAYDELQWPTAVSVIHPDNSASKRVAARVGAALEKQTALKGSPVDVFRHPVPGKTQ